MNPWLQEFPDPITKLVWDNAAVVSPKTATELGVKFADRVALTVSAVKLDIPVFVLPGQADYSVALAYGQYGEMRVARVPDGGGTNVFPARKGGGFVHAVETRDAEKPRRPRPKAAVHRHHTHASAPDGAFHVSRR